jgi:hypothetical protein
MSSARQRAQKPTTVGVNLLLDKLMFIPTVFIWLAL